MKDFRNPPDIHEPLGSYSHQIEISEDERLLVISGQVGMRQDGMVPEDPYEQMDLAFENIFRNLRAANMDMQDIVKLTYYLVGEFDTPYVPSRNRGLGHPFGSGLIAIVK